MRTVKNFRIWSLLFAGIALRILPERVKGQHRAGEIIVWASSYPRLID
jgi:hypothetical protein